jgi:hypothetical protein
MKNGSVDADLLESIRATFAGRPTLNFKDSSNLLKINEKTLRSHVRLGNIRFRLVGLGHIRRRREFALEDIIGFYVGRSTGMENQPSGGRTVRTRKTGLRCFLEGRAERRVQRSLDTANSRKQT